MPGPLAAEELLEERIGRNHLLSVHLLADRDDRRLRALDGADDSILVATPLSGTAASAGGVRLGPGCAAEVTARVEHHEEASYNGAHQPNNDRGQYTIVHHLKPIPCS